MLLVGLLSAQLVSLRAARATEEELKSKVGDFYFEIEQNLRRPKGSAPDSKAVQGLEGLLKGRAEQRETDSKKRQREAEQASREENRGETDLPDDASDNSPGAALEGDAPPTKPSISPKANPGAPAKASSPSPNPKPTPSSTPAREQPVIESTGGPKEIVFPGPAKTGGAN
jgi:hypothetical protein